MKPLFELKNVKYGVYIDIPELLIEDNKITTLIGPSGSGKTTILKILNKMLSPTHGQVLFKGQDLNNLQSIEHRRKVVMFSQNPVVFDGSVRDNLNAGLIFQEKEPAESSKLKYALELV